MRIGECRYLRSVIGALDLKPESVEGEVYDREA